MISIYRNFVLDSYKQMVPFLKGTNYGQHFPIMDIIVYFCISELSAMKGYWMQSIVLA